MNRFPVLLKALDVLRDRKEVLDRNFKTPRLDSLRAYIDSGNPLNNAGLMAYVAEHPEDSEMQNVLAWSLSVNKRIAEMVHGVPPFTHVADCLQALSEFADIVIVSATETKALQREWQSGGLLELVTEVCGQEMGSKKEIIARYRNSYPEGHVLMIGDAPGDRDAAKANGVLFYPICPDQEAESWEQFGQAMDAFRKGCYGQMEKEKIAYFETLLPDTPAWERG